MCMKHLVRDQLPVEDVINWGFSQKKVRYPETIPRFLCIPCHNALLQKEG